MALTIWLVRHGETSSNAAGMFQGHLDVALNERGEQQAAAVGRALAGHHFDAVYASDLQRAARTAEIVVDGRHPVLLDPDLREMNYGVLQGARYHDAPDVLREHGLAELWSSGELHRRGLALPGGESSRQFRSRSRRFVARLDAAHPAEGDDEIMVVAHGGKLAVLLTVLLGLSGVHRHQFRFANCSLTRVTRTELRTALDFHNLVVWGEGPLAVARQLLGRHEPRGEAEAGPRE